MSTRTLSQATPALIDVTPDDHGELYRRAQQTLRPSPPDSRFAGSNVLRLAEPRHLRGRLVGSREVPQGRHLNTAQPMHD